jgi:thiamine phosphate synthase YjbQ (UPF0047 family)
MNKYKHNNNKTGHDNTDPHLKRHIMGREFVIAIAKVKLDLPLRTSILSRIRRSLEQKGSS